MKRLLVLLAVMSLASVVSANCGNGNGNGNACNGNNGGQPGPQGPQGPSGNDGSDGKDGANGADGADGRDATADQSNVGVYVGVDVEWAEYGPLSFSSGYHYDARRHDHVVDALTIGIKIGKSSEERRIEALEKKLKELGK